MTKGQMSLEMIIGLLILLVVAFVVIRLFLNQTQGLGGLTDVRKSLAYNEFKQGCDQMCKESNIVKWCSTKLTGDTDLNRNGRVDAVDSEGLFGFKACENAIYCMNMFECNTDQGKVTPQDCLATLCSAYYSSYQDISKANIKVKQVFPDYGTCVLKPDENWFTYYGFNSSTPCTGSGTGGGTTTTTTSGVSVASITCTQTSSDTATCQWNCPSVNNGKVVLTATPIKTIGISTTTGSYPFNGLNKGTYNVALVCDIDHPEGSVPGQAVIS